MTQDEIHSAVLKGLRLLRDQLVDAKESATAIRAQIRAALVEAKSRGVSTNEMADALKWTPGRVRQLLNSVPEYKENK